MMLSSGRNSKQRSRAADRGRDRQTGSKYWLEILKLVPGRISTEVDARLSMTPKRQLRKQNA